MGESLIELERLVQEKEFKIKLALEELIRGYDQAIHDAEKKRRYFTRLLEKQEIRKGFVFTGVKKRGRPRKLVLEPEGKIEEKARGRGRSKVYLDRLNESNENISGTEELIKEKKEEHNQKQNEYKAIRKAIAPIVIEEEEVQLDPSNLGLKKEKWYLKGKVKIQFMGYNEEWEAYEFSDKAGHPHWFRGDLLLKLREQKTFKRIKQAAIFT